MKALTVAHPYFCFFNKKSSRQFSGVACVAALFLLLLTSGYAQSTTAEQKGLPTNSSYSGGQIDQVNLQNGNLHVSIPILSVKQRGGSTLSWDFVYDTQTWIKKYIPHQYPNCNSIGGACIPPGEYIISTIDNAPGGWRFTSPLNWQVHGTLNQGGGLGVPCPLQDGEYYQPITNWVVVDPQGTSHPLPLRNEPQPKNPVACLPGSSEVFEGPTLDGSGMYFNSKTGLLTLKDGTQVQLQAGALFYEFFNAKITDSNGNQMGPNDTMGRPLVTETSGPSTTLVSPNDQQLNNPAYTIYTLMDSNGNPETYRIDYELIDIHPDFCSMGFGDGNIQCSATDDALVVPKQLTLPNEKAYQFSYYNNSAGEIQSITLPTGATINYTYGEYQESQAAIKGQRSSIVGNKAVSSRTETINGVASTWNYSLGFNESDEVDPLGNVTEHMWSKLHVPTFGGASSSYYEMTTVYADSAKHALRTVDNTYAAEYDPMNNAIANARVTSRKITLDNGQVTQKDTDYAVFSYTCTYVGCPATATRLDPVEERDYDYGQGGPGALLRRTDTSYATFLKNNASITKPQTVTVYDGNGSAISSTIYEYDNYGRSAQPMQSSGAIQHDPSYGVSFTSRGNITAISKWRNTDGANISITNQYDDAGNILSIMDANGNKSTFDYSDSWANRACEPAGQSKMYRTSTTNAKGQTSTSTYNSCTGTVAQTKDANGSITNVTYDLLNRTKQVVRPLGGGQITYCYSDDPNGECADSDTWKATRTDKITNSLNLVQASIYDGLGRVTSSQLVSDPEGVVTTDTIYDALGRTLQVSNPYRTNDPKYWTVSTYDGISRLIAVTKPDGSVSHIDYSGNVTVNTDETGRKRKSLTDALGRLLTVWEDPDGQNYETDYSYDVLGDLLQATQKGGSSDPADWRKRTFTYNSIGQLLCSANPEIGSPFAALASCPVIDNGEYIPGTIRYKYDNNGNVISKTAPAPNQQGSATVTTSYSYDQLNQLTSVSYSDGTAGATYVYDNDAPPSNCSLPNISASNVLGHMRGMCDASGATAWSFDAMGRTTAEVRRIGTISNQTGYTYTLNGIVQSITYPAAGDSSSFTITYNINGAGRADTVSDDSKTYAHVDSTWAHGAPKSYTYGSNIRLEDSYNSMLQPLTLTAQQMNPSNTLFSKTYDFHQGRGDNGSLWAVADGLDTMGLDRPNGSVQYDYDAMNRVISAHTLGNDCSAVRGGTRDWGESYTIDPWGNMTRQTVTRCTADSLSTVSNSRNQLLAAVYDSAGNTIQNNGTSFNYDAAGRIISASGVSYIYDGAGQRVYKPGKLYWRGVGSDALVETTESGTNPMRYIFFGGKRIARIDPGTTEPKYYVADNVGSTSLVTDSEGNVLNESLFFPYGTEQAVQQGTCNAYKFSGKERDPESGNDYFGARYYASNLGRFMSPDWNAKPTTVPYASFGDPQTLNLYSYVENAPLNRVDADGHQATQNAGNSWSLPIDFRVCFKYPCGAEDGIGLVMNFGTPNQLADLSAALGAALAANWAAAGTGAQQQNAGTGGIASGGTPYSLNLGGITVNGSVSRVDFRDGETGIKITGNTEGCPSTCMWVSTYQRTGSTTEGPTTDRDPGNTVPLYPFTGSPVNFADRPTVSASGHGTFTAVTTVGIADPRAKSFIPLGSMTYSFSVDRSRNVSFTMPQVASPGAVMRSMSVLRSESPTWTIAP